MATTPASIGKHPVHPMIIALPIGMWILGAVCDVIAFRTQAPDWQSAAFVAIAGGIIGALIAAVPGFIDYFSLTPGSKAKRIGTFHMIVNLAAVAVFGLNLYLRNRFAEDSAVPMIMSIAGVLLIGVGGWLGGELVYVE